MLPSDLQEQATRWLACLLGRDSHPFDYTTLPGRTCETINIGLLKTILDVHAFVMHIACTSQRGGDLPEDVYVQLNYLAEKEYRSMAQEETIVILKEGIASRLGNKERRKTLLETANVLDIDGVTLPDPVDLIREDRDR